MSVLDTRRATPSCAEGKVRKLGGRYEETPSYTAPAVTFDDVHLKKSRDAPIGTSESKTIVTRPSWVRKITDRWHTFFIGGKGGGRGV